MGARERENTHLLRDEEIMKRKRGTYDGSAKRLGGPILKLNYDPLANAENMTAFLRDLIQWTLGGTIRARQASVCRAILQTQLAVDGYGELTGKIVEIEELLGGARKLFERAKAQSTVVSNA
jgi:hypothetical protein